MHGLAQFAMRSRLHAIAISLIAAAIPPLAWLSTIIVALVCLRHGVVTGSMLVLWTILPMGGWVYVSGDPSVLLTLVSTAGLALLLRKTLSWEVVLMASLVFSAISAGMFEWLAPGVIDRLIQIYMEYLQQLDASMQVSAEDAQAVLVGFFALGQALAMMVLLIIARWCQSGLYNPGGFKKEFHQLRLSSGFAAVIVAMMMLCFVFNEVLGRWLLLLTVPLLFSGLSFVHWFMAEKKLSKSWAIVFYVALLLLFQLVYPLLASIALMDSWFNLRNRIQTSQKD